MTPSTKATIALPVTLGLIALFCYLVSIHPGILIYPYLIASFAGIIGVVWYALYRSFGGEI